MSDKKEAVDRVVKHVLSAVVDAMDAESGPMDRECCLNVARGIYLSIVLATIDGLPDTSKILTGAMESKIVGTELARLALLPDIEEMEREEPSIETPMMSMPRHEGGSHGFSTN